MSDLSLNFQFKLESMGEIIEKRGLAVNGIVQQFIDNEVLKKCDPYVPMDTGALKDSGILATDIGSGTVVYNTPYARRQYHENKGGMGLRGKLWFERMKADHKDEILIGAAKIAGAKT